jgi:hypothetical protein
MTRAAGAGADRMRQRVEENRDNLFFFLLCLRLFPVSPNFLLKWVLLRACPCSPAHAIRQRGANFSFRLADTRSMTSPIVGVPLPKFFFSVFFGLMPYNFLCVQAGTALSELDVTPARASGPAGP